MEKRSNRRRWRILGAVALVPVLVVAGFALYLANLGGYLPWQEDPTPILVTPFANISASASTAPALALAQSASPAASPDAGTTASPPTGSASPAPAVAAGGTVFTVVAEQSEARYVVQETVGRLKTPTEAIGRTKAMRGQLILDGDGKPLEGSAIEVDLRTLRSDQPRRDNFIQTQTLKNAPLAEFVITGVRDWTAPLADGQERTFTLVGTLTINGVSRETSFATTGTMNGNTVVGTASTTFTWPDFNLKAPNVAATMISVEDTARIELDITATR
jgi:polyisoprenoid-binding protein YceI